MLHNLIMIKNDNIYSEIISYWEGKRIVYNLIIGLVGLTFYFSSISEYGLLSLYSIYILAIILLLNVVYSFGCYICILLSHNDIVADDKIIYYSKLLILLGTIMSLFVVVSLFVLPYLAMISD